MLKGSLIRVIPYLFLLLFLAISVIAEDESDTRKQHARAILDALRAKHGKLPACDDVASDNEPTRIIYLADGPAEEKKKTIPPIVDNSFYIEEAINQDEGVSQTIATMQRNRNRSWDATVTHEFPMGDVTHQGSITVPASHIKEVGSPSATGVGDVNVAYRYNVNTGNKKILFTPRASLLVPIGNAKAGLGSNALGYQTNLPVTVILSPKVMTHYNLGYTHIPNSQNTAGERENIGEWNYGASAVYLFKDDINFLAEVFSTSMRKTLADGTKAYADDCFVSPGVRFRKRNKNHEWVYGIARPFRVSGIDDGSDPKVYLYVSFEQ